MAQADGAMGGDRLTDGGLGLAPVTAPPREEVDYLLGDLEHITHRRHRESRVAAVGSISQALSRSGRLRLRSR